MSNGKQKHISGGDAKEKNTKIKGVAFNLNNPIEKWMYDETEKMKGKGSYSFSSLMKYLFLAYLSKGEIGSTHPKMEPPQLEDDEQAATAATEEISININEDDQGIMGVQFSLDD